MTKAIEAAVRAFRQAAGEGEVMEWQPIEAAPKAAPRLLLLVPPYGVFTGCWCPDPEYPWSGAWSIPGLLNKKVRPTHWMPLPPPPTDEQGWGGD